MRRPPMKSPNAHVRLGPALLPSWCWRRYASRWNRLLIFHTRALFNPAPVSMEARSVGVVDVYPTNGQQKRNITHHGGRELVCVVPINGRRERKRVLEHGGLPIAQPRGEETQHFRIFLRSRVQHTLLGHPIHDQAQRIREN